MIGVLYAHKILMVLMTALLIYAVSKAYLKADNWFDQHQRFALIGVTAGLFGFAAIVVFKIVMQYPHFKSAHAWAGLISVLAFTGVPLGGKLILSGMNSLRPLHKIGGRFVIIAAVITALLKVF